MQSGVIGGSENTASKIYTRKMREVQKYMAVSGHGCIGYAVIANNKLWDARPAGLRATLERAIRPAAEFHRDLGFDPAKL
jgi:C4-dicarboxylate-binding protein DctP